MIGLLPVPDLLQSSPYGTYVYAYPHKTAYRSLSPARRLNQVWRHEPQSNLSLYWHVPFCTMRCGFCNLFTTPRPDDNLVTHFLDALERQAQATREAIPTARFTRLAIGGGTPTYLNRAQLERLLDLMRDVMGVTPLDAPCSVEASPDTITVDKLALLRERGVERLSIGVQSFIEIETADSGRPQTRAIVDEALGRAQSAEFPVLNVDLIYGLPHQTVESWLQSARLALRFEPTELYLYPLYVRPLTGLGRSRKSWDDWRLECYREARDLLLAEGYEQWSMRLFRRRSAGRGTSHYCCQDDGMVGLGVGARSYTRALHYSLEYAVAPRGVREIIANYVARDPAEMAIVDRGFELDDDEQKRRFLLQSILNADGLSGVHYRQRFEVDPEIDFPELSALAEVGLIERDEDDWRPTALGLERSDAIGPLFFSARARRLMEEHQPQ